MSEPGWRTDVSVGSLIGSLCGVTWWVIHNTGAALDLALSVAVWVATVTFVILTIGVIDR